MSCGFPKPSNDFNFFNVASIMVDNKISDRMIPSQASVFSLRVSDFLQKHARLQVPPVFTPQTSCEDIIASLISEKVDCAIIVDPTSERICGIITESDVVRHLAPSAGFVGQASSFMTRQVQSVEDQDYLYYAIAAMQKLKLRHMPVVDGGGKLIGLLRLHEAMDFCASGMFQHLRWMHSGVKDIASLKAMKAKQVDLAAEMMREYVPVPHIQAVLSQINREINRYVIEIVMQELSAAGYGEPKVGFAVLMMGSGGREENFLSPDQDNGIIIDDYPDSEHDRIDTWFRAFSEKMNVYLDDVGFPLCAGYVMARNPVWRKTLSQWRQQTETWIVKKTSFAVSYADIFFDFTHLYGERDLVITLRQHVHALLRSNPSFVWALFSEGDSRVSLPLGWFDRLKPISSFSDSEHAGQINMKHNVIMPAVQILRHLALKFAITETTSKKRLQALCDKGFFSNGEVSNILSAFDVATGILLGNQIQQYRQQAEVNNYVRLKALSAIQRANLRRSLLTIRGMHAKAMAEMMGRVL